MSTILSKSVLVLVLVLECSYPLLISAGVLCPYIGRHTYLEIQYLAPGSYEQFMV